MQSCSNPFNQVLGDENENENDENDAEMIYDVGRTCVRRFDLC